MNVDKSNYEIWLIDWLDGNLNEIQCEHLLCFLNENPDLKEEFDELATFRLKPSGKSFPAKDRLKKTPTTLSDSQFEYLFVAYLENDLSSEQQTELRESIELDSEKKLSFELIQKLKLSPVSLSYKYKHRLIRRTIVQNVIRLSIIGLSAAAITTLAIISYTTKPNLLQLKYDKTAQTIIVENSIKKKVVETVSRGIKTERNIILPEKQNKRLSGVPEKGSSSISAINLNSPIQNDSVPGSANLPLTLLNKIPVSKEIGLRKETISNTLIALNYTIVVPEYDDGRSRLSKFIAKTFREKILNEKKAKDSPLKVYEIAEAGVSGLDKLLGWEMALDEKKDLNGDIKSVYFSSKILKFNAPVKKSELLQ
jgi:DNA-binding transcriptional ArsR family regulator